ncbi:GM19292 [Drosophila sechellia]|uniref:GM19292 n=1 Tax=Drosophila sechellia TaxID=7238 RepID=B4IM78_DROSE|nr:GM19292 [Drosophila sechellia]
MAADCVKRAIKTRNTAWGGGEGGGGVGVRGCDGGIDGARVGIGACAGVSRGGVGSGSGDDGCVGGGGRGNGGAHSASSFSCSRANRSYHESSEQRPSAHPLSAGTAAGWRLVPPRNSSHPPGRWCDSEAYSPISLSSDDTSAGSVSPPSLSSLVEERLTTSTAPFVSITGSSSSNSTSGIFSGPSIFPGDGDRDTRVNKEVGNDIGDLCDQPSTSHQAAIAAAKRDAASASITSSLNNAQSKPPPIVMEGVDIVCLMMQSIENIAVKPLCHMRVVSSLAIQRNTAVSSNVPANTQPRTVLGHASSCALATTVVDSNLRIINVAANYKRS